MTAGSPPPAIRTYQEVIDQGYKVHVRNWKSVSFGQLMKASYGSAKHIYYLDNFMEDAQKIHKYEKIKLKGDFKVIPGSGGIFDNLILKQFLNVLLHYNILLITLLLN